MHTDEELGRLIEQSFGDGPGTVPLDDLVERGHRALARRRMVLATAAAAVVVAVGGGAALAGDGGRDDAGGPGFATSATPTPSGSPTGPGPSPTVPGPGRAEMRRVLNSSPVEYDARGRLRIDPRATVLTRIDDPYTRGDTDDSVAIEARFRGWVYWFAEHHSRDGSSGGSTQYAPDWTTGTFEDWVLAQDPGPDTAGSVGPDVWPGTVDADLVHFSEDGTERLVATTGARIVVQRAHVSVGGSFAGPGDRTAAAEVVSADGSHLYVLARSFDGKPGQYIYVSKPEGGRDLADFLDLARHRYAAGGGGLL